MTERETMTAAEFNAMQVKTPTRKYRNEPTVVDGIRFDSKSEARRFQELKLMERAGEIGELALQPKFDLTVNGVKICAYIGDFEYFRGDQQVIEDVKSPASKTPVYRLKKRLMKAIHRIDITEVN